MAVIDFKSVGNTVSKQNDIDTAASGSALPIGIATPLSLGKKSEGIFKMHKSLENQLADNLRNLLLTNHGERLGIYEFGANLRPLALEYESREDFDTEAIIRIRESVGIFMPFIELNTFESSSDNFNNQHTGKIKISITYSIPALNASNKRIDITLYVA